MDLPLIFHPNSDILQVECTPLSTEDIVSEKVQTMIDNMIPTMYHGQGIGLAAPQIGTTIQVCIIGKDAFPKKVMINGKKHDRSKDLILINPVWEKTARRTYWDTEGCLSIPKIYGKVKRYKHIRIQAQNRLGEPITLDASNFFGRVIQHEIDHLHGILFIEKGKDIYKVE